MPKGTHPVQTTGTLTLTHISKIHPNDRNVRSDLGDLTDLAASITAEGIVEPLTAYSHPDGDGHIILVDGHRRWAAAGIAGLDDLPVILRAAPARAEQVKIMLVTGLHGQSLSPMDKARGMGELRDSDMSGAQIAKAIGMSIATVSMYMSLLELDVASQRRVDRGELPVQVAVTAVREMRARQRKQDGQKDRRESTSASWEPDHFGTGHPLARKAQGICSARGHNGRRRLGGVACGVCFEEAIRADARVVLLAEMQQQAEVTFMPPPGVMTPFAQTG